MSLTSELKRAGSPVGQFFDSCFDASQMAAFLKRVRVEQRAWTLRATGDGVSSGYSGVVGTAFDYMVRTATWGLKLDGSVAEAAVMRETGFQWAPGDDLILDTTTGELYDLEDWRTRQAQTSDFARKMWLHQLWHEVVDQWSHIADNEVESLIRLSVVLAWLEGIFRSGQWSTALMEGQQLGERLDAVSQRIPPAVIADLVDLLRDYQATQFRLWHGQPVAQNPVFTGSRDVGGADADWIVDRTLWDMKTTKSPWTTVERDIKQVVAYVLMDYADKYQIEHIGLYYPRFGEALRWPVDSLLGELTGTFQPIEGWRARWRDAVAP